MTNSVQFWWHWFSVTFGRKGQPKCRPCRRAVIGNCRWAKESPCRLFSPSSDFALATLSATFRLSVHVLVLFYRNSVNFKWCVHQIRVFIVFEKKTRQIVDGCLKLSLSWNKQEFECNISIAKHYWFCSISGSAFGVLYKRIKFEAPSIGMETVTFFNSNEILK